MARVVGEKGLVIAFEPQINNIQLLKINISQNNINNVQLQEVALGHKNMVTCLCNAYYGNEKNFVSTHYDRGEDDLNISDFIGKNNRLLPINKEVIKCTTLDDIQIEEGRTIKFIKIDVQGFEKMVLEGGQKTLAKHRPVMVIELEDPCMDLFGYTSRELIAYLRTLGYQIYFLDYSYPCDHVCVPWEKVNDFEEKFKGKIHQHTQSNPQNHNVENGVSKKVCL